jgi:hypothetical protein
MQYLTLPVFSNVTNSRFDVKDDSRLKLSSLKADNQFWVTPVPICFIGPVSANTLGKPLMRISLCKATVWT